jgi:hypothetical protein
MKQIYGIEPDLCIQNPALILDFGKDIILPQYFYEQLKHLQAGNYYQVTESANQIFQSLQLIEELDNILVFKTPQNGVIYFLNQEISLNNTEFTEDQFDLSNPLHRYLLSLLSLSRLLGTSTTFLINSSALISKCTLLKFGLVNVSDFSHYSESWLNADLILSSESKLTAVTPRREITEIEWTDDSEIISQFIPNISWQDL